MKIEQFENKQLAQFGYAILSENENKVILIDPARDAEPYYAFAKANNAEIVGIIETHPHADFVSSHLEISKTTGATIYISGLAGASYDHTAFDDLSKIVIGEIELTALNTPGHSPDSISVLMALDGKDYAVFTGDTLFMGDCGRPDLRETAGVQTADRTQLAGSMYHSLREVLGTLGGDVLVYPAHGAGSLCGKSLRAAHSSTIAEEKDSNWSMQEMDEQAFVEQLLTDQPFIPAYFGFDVDLNLKGAENLKQAIGTVPVIEQPGQEVLEKTVIVDTRDQHQFKEGHLPNSINIMATGAFETWLGTLISPGQAFYLTAENPEILHAMLLRAAAIGYETFIEGAFVFSSGEETLKLADPEQLKNNPESYTIVDVRNEAEVNARKIFPTSLHIPLADLNERWQEIPTTRPVVVHCAGGYRSAAASSLLNDLLRDQTTVYDLSESIKQF